MNSHLTELGISIIQQLKTQKIILCTIESCTGGLIAHLLTRVPGASEVFWGSWVAYDNSAKLQLGVSKQTLSDHGAVSPEVAAELAQNGLEHLKTALAQHPSSSLTRPTQLLAISTTGIAGPSGGTLEKPVGLCYCAVASSGRPPTTLAIQAPEGLNRTQTQEFFAQRALEFVLKQSQSYETNKLK